MVSQLLSPSQPKNMSDLLILALLAIHIFALYILPSGLKVPVFALIFLFWRAGYNAGIGWLLQNQSNNNRLVNWAKMSRVFEDPKSGNNPHPKLNAFLKKEMETKIPHDYKFEEAPIEYNTWLVFRRVVDVILMCDFVSYCLFAIACGGRPADESLFMTASRWVAGILLFLFNLWVKLDAHRVVKDYAWYWGDFFYLIDQELTFDGVFEMAPHPMYSVGYAGYYGISLMAASYKVLFISIIAHAAQFAFLTLIENPHIDKTYNPPAPRKRTYSGVEGRPQLDGQGQDDTDAILEPASSDPDKPSTVHNLLGGIRNLDFHRVTDVSVMILHFYAFALAVMTPSSTFYQFIFVGNALFWRLWYTMGIGYLLDRQSRKKSWTRHFIKYGDTTREAWRQWKGIYHLSMNMCYASFIAAAWKMYHLPPDWNYGMVLIRHVVGAGLIGLHIWTAVSVYESLGEFGWFYGDFFYDQAPKLTYSGIYRFLNNPERFFGIAGVWAFAIITWSKAIFLLAVVSHILMLAFLQFVERPHMQRLYGETVRRQSGLSKSIRRSMPPPIRQLQGRVDRGFEEVTDFIEDTINAIHARFTNDVGNLVKDSKNLIKQSTSKMNITRIADDLANFDPKDYSISIEGTPTSTYAEIDRSSSGREGESARTPPRRDSNFKPSILEYGAPIKVRWTAPANHSAKDWIGLYMVSDNASREVTRIASRGRWIATTPGVYDTSRADAGLISSNVKMENRGVNGKEMVSGEMEFSGDKLWWTTGVFEFRLHHDGKHNVMALSLPFEIRIGKFDEDDVEIDASLDLSRQTSGVSHMQTAVEKALLPVLRNCFDRDAEIAPDTIDEPFGTLVERDGKFAKRVVFAVHQMFGIEFAAEVVQADGNVRNLAWRICNAKKVLVSSSSLCRYCGRIRGFRLLTGF